MPLNTDCSGSELAGLFKWNFIAKGPVLDPRISKEGVASSDNDPNPNLLEGFIPPGEFAAR